MTESHYIPPTGDSQQPLNPEHSYTHSEETAPVAASATPPTASKPKSPGCAIGCTVIFLIFLMIVGPFLAYIGNGVLPFLGIPVIILIAMWMNYAKSRN